jgi:hypothetical protein
MALLKIHVNDLLKDELEFELLCRGISDILTVTPMRKILREIFNRETEEASRIKLTAPLVCSEQPLSQLLICETKLNGIVQTVNEVEGTSGTNGPIIKRLISRLLHLQNRIKFIVPGDEYLHQHFAIGEMIEQILDRLISVEREFRADDDEDVLTENMKEILERSLGEEGKQIFAKLQLSVPLPRRSNNKGFGIHKVNNSKVTCKTHESDNQSDNVGLRVGESSSRDIDSQLKKCSTSEKDFIRRKLVPIRDWGIKFSGKGGLSINAFIERIIELKDARNAGDEDLWIYAIDFFEGDALIWYRANRDCVNNWKELVDLLVITFQRPYYQDELLEEIRNRTQGKYENVNIYVAVMQNMFKRLPERLNELQKVSILLKNIQPYYQQAVCRDEFKSVGELVKVLRIIERTKTNCDNFQEPVKVSNLLEPDLAYQGHSREEVNFVKQKPAELNNSNSADGMKCWNCRAVGHSFRFCSIPRQRLFCFKCGKFGQTTNNCTTCQSAGNGKSEDIKPAECLP